MEVSPAVSFKHFAVFNHCCHRWLNKSRGPTGSTAMCGVYLITIVAAIRVHVRCSARLQQRRQSLQLTHALRLEAAGGQCVLGCWEFNTTTPRTRTLSTVGTFCTIILRSIIVKYFTKSGYLYLRVPQMALSPQIAWDRSGVMSMLRYRGCPNEIAIIWS